METQRCPLCELATVSLTVVVSVIPGTQHLTPTEDGADLGLRLLCSQALHSAERMSWTSLSRPPSSLNQPSQHTAEAGKWTSRLCSLLPGRASDLSMSLLSLVFCLFACCCSSFMAWLRVSRKCGWEDQHCFRTIKTTLAENQSLFPWVLLWDRTSVFFSDSPSFPTQSC